jgi:F-type H+-transporting ATPase subunit b
MIEEAKTAAEAAGVLGSLGIDGKIFLAQLVNISVVIFVMWKWVYRPLLKVMDERTKKIEQGLHDAKESTLLRQRAGDEKDQVIVEARLKAKAIIEEAQAKAQEEGVLLLDKSRREVNRLLDQGREQLRKEKDEMIDQIKSDIGGLLALAVEKIAQEKLDEVKDEKLIRSSLQAAELL